MSKHFLCWREKTIAKQLYRECTGKEVENNEKRLRGRGKTDL